MKERQQKRRTDQSQPFSHFHSFDIRANAITSRQPHQDNHIKTKGEDQIYTPKRQLSLAERKLPAINELT